MAQSGFRKVLEKYGWFIASGFVPPVFFALAWFISSVCWPRPTDDELALSHVVSNIPSFGIIPFMFVFILLGYLKRKHPNTFLSKYPICLILGAFVVSTLLSMAFFAIFI